MFDPINAFRQRIADGELLVGTSIALSDAQTSEALAPSLDFLWIDLEHAPMSPEAMRGHLLAARYKGTPVVVRVADYTTPYVKNALDAGAPGVIAPQITSVDQVRSFVGDCRYPPQGKRGFGPTVPSDYGRDASAAYVARANSGVFAAVMIETVAAVEAIEDIVAVPGLDSIVLGPWDLSGSFGRLGEVDHPEVVAAIEKVIATARDAGVLVGSGMSNDPAFGRTMIERGVQWLQMSNDCGLLIWAAERMRHAVLGGAD